jgi:RNA polymerase sigma factor (sigma-70 family)
VQPGAKTSIPYFKTTQWTMVRQVQDEDGDKAAQALAMLCEAYWYPIYVFIRRSGIKPHDAEDLSQGFFARLLSNNSLASADPAKGKLRTFLLACLRNYLGDERDRATAQKRGAALLSSFDAVLAEELYREEALDDLSPDRLFQRRWALSVLESSMELLAQEFELSGKGEIFAELKPFLGFGAKPEKGYDEISRALGIPVGTLKNQVHRLRERWCAILFEQVGMTLEDPTPENIKSELQELLGYV